MTPTFSAASRVRAGSVGGVGDRKWTFTISPDLADLQPDGSLSVTNPPAVQEMLDEILRDVVTVITEALFETIWRDDGEGTATSDDDVRAENHRLRLENQQLRDELVSAREARQRLVQIDFRTERLAQFFDFDDRPEDEAE